MVHHQTAEYHVKRVVRKGELFDQANLEVDSKLAPGRFVASSGVHLRRRIDAMYLAACANALFRYYRHRSCAATNLQHLLARLQPGQVNGHTPHGRLSSESEEAYHTIIEPRPCNNAPSCLRGQLLSQSPMAMVS